MTFLIFIYFGTYLSPLSKWLTTVKNGSQIHVICHCYASPHDKEFIEFILTLGLRLKERI